MHPPLAAAYVSLGKALVVGGGEATRWILLISAEAIMVAHRKKAAVLVGVCDAETTSLQIAAATERSL